jgi:hypothetical protein
MIRAMGIGMNRTLYYTVADGEIVFANPYTQPLYNQLTEVMTEQMAATRINLAAHDLYLLKLAGYQGAIDTGRLLTTVPKLVLPEKPGFKVVLDAPQVSEDPALDGTPVWTEIQWPGVLPNPVFPKTV